MKRKGTYWKEIGGYKGVVWLQGRWAIFDCETCGLELGQLKPGTRRQGPPTDAQWRAYLLGKVELRWHDPLGHRGTSTKGREGQ